MSLADKLERSHRTARVIYTHRPRWTAPVGSAAHDLKHGAILPMVTPRRPLLDRIFGARP